MMKKENVVLYEENLYFIEGFDGKYWIIRIESERGLEVNISRDTFQIIKTSAISGISLLDAFEITDKIRDEKIIWKEITVLLEKGVINTR